MTTTVAYLVALAALLLAIQVFLGFERQPVETAVEALGDRRRRRHEHREQPDAEPETPCG